MKDATETTQQVGRLALRVEGSMWNAYYARNNTMAGALHIGSIPISAVMAKPELKQSFMELMQGVIEFVFEDSVGQTPSWGGPECAPETERGGHA